MTLAPEPDKSIACLRPSGNWFWRWAATLVGFLLLACATTVSSVSLKFVRHPKTPKTASVIIDEQYIGPLYFVAARGVRLPEGPHRITITKTGYFPWDTLVIAKDEPIKLQVQLVEIPD